ncbi:MAG TPA: O-antigen ligase family protein [bacterium]|nr:O-antigen ligase family protein [bacterium]
MNAAANAGERTHATSMEQIGLLLLVGVVMVAVGVLPLLLDFSSLDDTYYGVKARALMILAPVLLVGLLTASGGKELRRAGLLGPLVAFAGAAALATALSVNPAWSIQGAPQRHEGLLSLLAYPAICAATLVVVARGGWRLWCGAALTCAAVVAGYGIAQYFGWEWLVRDPIRVFWWRPFSTSGNPNFLGAYMVLMSPLASSVLLTSRRRITAVLVGGALGLMVLAALCTYSRAAWLGLVVAAVVFAVALRPGRTAEPFPATMKSRLLGSVAFMVVLAGLFFFPGSPLATRRADWSAAQRAQTAVEPGDPQAGFRQRSYLWSHTVVLLLRRPLLGYGPETFSLVFPQGWDEERTLLFGASPVRIDKAHNDTLDMAMSIGALGVVAFGWVLVSTLRNATSAWDPSSPPRAMAAACVASIAGYWVDVQWHFSVVSVAPVFWSVLGATSGLAILRTRRTP